MTKILMIIGQKNFRDEELLIPKEIFEKEGFEVVVASKQKGLCTGKLGAKIESDISIYDAYVKNFDTIVFVGGMGSLMYEDDIKVHELIKEYLNYGNKILASICISPRILIKAKILENKNFTMWNNDNSQNNIINQSKGTYLKENVVVDNNIITANSPQSAKEFARKIVEMLRE